MGTNGRVTPHAARWQGIERPYSSDEVERLRGSVVVEHTLARLGAERLWTLRQTEPFVPSLGALSGGQAVQMVKAGLKAIYVSGWQVAADANLAGHTYPDQSLYPANSASATIGASQCRSRSPSAQWIWSARSSALLIRRTSAGAVLAGYRLWSG